MLSHVNRFFEIFFYPPAQIVISILGLMLIGLMVSIFIGDHIILSGIRHEKKVEEATKTLVKEEEITLKHIKDEIVELRKEIRDISKKN